MAHEHARAETRIGDLTIDFGARSVHRGAQELTLRPKEFDLLAALVRHRGRVVSREELLREVWQMSPDAGTNVVDVYVNYLRKKLEPKVSAAFGASSPIETVRGEGYRLRAARTSREESSLAESGLEISA